MHDPAPHSETDRAPLSSVVALSIVRGDILTAAARSKEAEILLAVRHPGSNATHPNVVSVPTLRVPPVLMRFLMDTLAPVETRPDGGVFYRFPEIRSDRDNGHHPLVFMAEALLAGKLGMAEHLEQGRLVFSSRLFSVTRGTAYYTTENPYGRSESIAMGNMLVSVLKGFDLFPRENASYSMIFPASLAALEQAKITGDLSGMPVKLDPALHRIGGLCIESTLHVIRHVFPPPRPAG